MLYYSAMSQYLEVEFSVQHKPCGTIPHNHHIVSCCRGILAFRMQVQDTSISWYGNHGYGGTRARLWWLADTAKNWKASQRTCCLIATARLPPTLDYVIQWFSMLGICLLIRTCLAWMWMSVYLLSVETCNDLHF